MNDTLSRFFIVLLFTILPFSAISSFHDWDISEIFTNQDGSIQYVELTTNSAGQGELLNHTLVADSDGTIVTFTIPNDVSSDTANKKLLFASAAFEGVQGSVVPDFILPTQFFNHNATTISINFANVDTVTFGSIDIPSDGFLSIDDSLLQGVNSATNFIGETGQISHYLYEDGFEELCAGFKVVYSDLDGDTFGNVDVAVATCGNVLGYVDDKLDCDDTNDAINPMASDIPDVGFVDNNCDGIDGDINLSIFVATTGSGDGLSPSTPRSDLAGALIQSVSTNRRWVLIMDGFYNQSFNLISGVNIAGNYSNQFANRNSQLVTTIISSSGFKLSNSNLPMEYQYINLQALNGLGSGGSSMALTLTSVTDLLLQEVTLTSGDGRNGIAGFNGSSPNNFTIGVGQIGGNGDVNNGGTFCSSNQSPTVGAVGFNNFCAAADGGLGGVPGSGNSNGSQGGQAQTQTPPIALGGDGGVSSSNPIISKGEIGQNGSNGIPGINGNGGSNFGNLSLSTGYETSNGTTGTAGRAGGGGGGGGGGAGSQSDCAYYGAAGGGGGAGACGADFGELGTGGGASIALALINSHVILNNSLIVTGSGGNGGNGGQGEAQKQGSIGGNGGIGISDSGAGGKGGTGGRGGRGGSGGGGGGGPSIGVYCQSSSSLSITGTTFQLGMSGTGGSSINGNSGANGRQGQVVNCL